MAGIPPEFEQLAAEMTPSEWGAFEAKVRAPDTTEAFREIAKSVVPEHALDELVRCTNVAAFVQDGKLDEPRIRQHLGIMFGQPAGSRRWGQGGQYQGSSGPGSSGRAEAQRRQGKPLPEPNVAGGADPGAQGRAEAERRRKNRR